MTKYFLVRKSTIVLFFCFLFFCLNCKTDPISNFNSNYFLKTKNFYLDSVRSSTISGLNNLFLSPRLYAGLIQDTLLVSSFIEFKNELFNYHAICSSDSSKNLYFSINTVTSLINQDSIIYSINKDSLNIKLIIDSDFLLKGLA